MAGKKSRGSKDKKSKGRTPADGDTDTDADAPGDTVDKNAVVGEACFKFRNKDHYLGGYRVTKSPLHACKEGPGEYSTRDGQTYTGSWQDDVLVGEAEVRFADGSRHVGQYEANAYLGVGAYIFEDEVVVRCEFADRPLGEMVLTDPRGRRWIGQAEESGATFLPVNRFLPVEDVTNRFHQKVEPSPAASLRSVGRISSKMSTKSSPKRSPRLSLAGRPASVPGGV